MSGIGTLGSKLIKLFMDGQSHSAMGIAKLLTGHEHERKAIYRVNHAVTYNTFKMDDTGVIQDLKGLGHSFARDRQPVLNPVFFTTPAKSFHSNLRAQGRACWDIKREVVCMTVDIKKYTKFLEQVASEIDISPSKYQDAVNHYQAVGRWLDDGSYPGFVGELEIYSQGSFRLGTVVRPIRNGIEASFDIDLVCQMPLVKEQTTPQSVKSMVGERLREHATYRKLLDREGRRCWTLEYAEQDSVGFHLDVLPAVPDGYVPLNTAIANTHKHESEYSWSASDPRGYGAWFDEKNSEAFLRVFREQKQDIQRRASVIYASVDSVPDHLVRTPLQRSIQIMKRHRGRTLQQLRAH